MEPISADEVNDHLRPDIRRLGVINHSLISNWDSWVKRRVEQIELVSDAAAKRRISVDFRLDPDAFGQAVVTEGKGEGNCRLHYVPLTLLKKAPFANFDLRDESGMALPLLTKKKTAAIGAATLVAATQSMIVQQVVGTSSQGAFADAINSKDASFDTNAIQIPDEIKANFLNLCVFPYVRSVDGRGELTAKEIREELLKKTAGKDPAPVSDWQWTPGEKGGWHAKDIDHDTWILGIFGEPVLNSLVFDFTRLYMVSAPVEAEVRRRRILKLEYEEHLREPGLEIVAKVRNRISNQAVWLRKREDALEGLNADSSVARREWTPPRSGMSPDHMPGSSGKESGGGVQTLREAIGMGVGWVAKPISFALPSVGLGGTFHLEINAPAGTQLRRAELRALDKKEDEDEMSVRTEIARRYARNVTRAHLYLGGDRRGTWGDASMAIKPKSSTVIRGAAIASCAVAILVFLALALGGSLGDDTQTAIAILLLAPGIVAAAAGQPFEHSVTSKMVFGLRLLALSVAGVAVFTAALLSAHLTFCDQPVLWTALVLLAAGLTAILLGAWRLAGRDWPRRLEV
jgi:hypothetical protein